MIPRILHHSASAGWLVLTGSTPTFGGDYPELANLLLQKLDLSRSPLMITARGDRASAIDDFMEEVDLLLGMRPPILLLGDEFDLDPGDINFVLLDGGDVESWFFALDDTALSDSLMQVMANDGLLMAAGAACANLGSWRFHPGDAEPVQGLNWLPGGLVLPGIPEPGKIPQVRKLLQENNNSYALGIPAGTAMAIGGRDSVEVWSQEAPKLVFGRGWQIDG